MIKKLLILPLLAIAACSHIGYEDSVIQTGVLTRSVDDVSKFEYPADFKNFDNHEQAIKSCALPEELLATLTTIELVEICGIQAVFIHRQCFFN